MNLSNIFTLLLSSTAASLMTYAPSVSVSTIDLPFLVGRLTVKVPSSSGVKKYTFIC